MTRARPDRRPQAPATPRHAAGLLLALLLYVLLPGHAHATCSFSGGTSWSSVSFAPPATISLPANLASGTQTVLWTSSEVTPGTTTTMNCSGNTNSGIQNYGATQPASGTLFPVLGIANLYFQILHPTDAMPVYPNYAVNENGGVNFSVASKLQLIATGPIANGTTLTARQLASWKIDTSNGAQSVEIFSTISSTTFVGPACSVAVDPTVVTLPTVSTTEFSGQGSTAGTTRFGIQLNCSSGSKLAITLATSSNGQNGPPSGGGQGNATGVITPSNGGPGNNNGNARDIGVQILDQNGDPVEFGTAITVTDSTPDGTYSVPFFARYYQTGSNVQAGQVTATATYTLSYP